MKIELPILGRIELSENKDWEYQYDARKWKYDFQGQPIDIDVNFKEVNPTKIEKATAALNNLSEIHEIGRKAIQKDFEEGETVKEYIKEWKEDIFPQIFSDTKFQNFIANTDKEKEIEERLFSLIRIVRIGFYLGSKDSFVVIDLAFGYDYEVGFRDDMLVISLSPALAVTNICTEG